MIQVALFPADSYGCGHYRMRLPAEHAPVLTSFHERVNLRTVKTATATELLGVDVNGADVAVFQRPIDHRLIAVMEQLKRQGVAVVVELDDDLCALDPKHVSFPALNPRWNPHMNWNHLKAACRAADLITVSTPALARRYAGHGRVVVLPNCVPASLLEIEAEKSFAIGWTGVVRTHPRDLEQLGDSIAELAGRGLDFGVVGDGKGVAAALGLAEVNATGWVDLDTYYQRMASFGCGVVPLANSAFNHAKSALKGIEFAALGVPFVASPLPEYLALASRGAGRLAAKPKRWTRQIEHALHDDEAGPAGREVVREHHTIEEEAWRWAEAWEKALATRRKAGRNGLVTA